MHVSDDEAEESSTTDESDDDDNTNFAVLRDTLLVQFQTQVQARLGLNKHVFDANFHAVLEQNWVKLGLSVLGSYRTDTWLENSSGWKTAYHGTKYCENIAKIVDEGLRIKGGLDGRTEYGDRFGTGIYVSEKIEFAEEYCKPFKMQNKFYHAVFQCRVRPGYFEETPSSRSILLIKDERDIRLYGILLREVQSPSSRHSQER